MSAVLPLLLGTNLGAASPLVEDRPQLLEVRSRARLRICTA
jgi:hypothetical protein